MPKTTVKKTNRVKRRRQTNGVRSSQRQREIDRRELPKEIDTVQGVLAERIGAGADRAFKTLGRAADVSVPDVPPKTAREGLLGTAASITGAVLGVGSMAVLTPVVVGLQLLNVRKPVQAAAEVLVGDTGRRAGESRQSPKSDLDRRKYRDESGEIHHHTHTYMRDHAGEMRSAA